MKKSFLKNTYFFYTCIFLLILPMIFLPFITDHRCLIWRLDGINQHYPTLLYYGKLLRGVLTGKGFPMIDFSIGMGFDTITTLNFYVLGDPISLLAIFMTAKNGVYVYNFLILLRFYLAGISFILFMRNWKKDGYGVILGALIYVFSGYSLYAGIRHPFFMNPMIYLPLIFLGIEHVLKKKKPYLLITIIFISTISNFYFLYILTMIAVVYFILRFFSEYHKEYTNALVGLFKAGLKTAGFYLLGIALAFVIFIPVLYAFSRNGRQDIKPFMTSGSYLYYTPRYYLTLIQGIFNPGVTPGYWTLLSFSAVTAVSIAIMLGSKKYRSLQIAYLLTFIGLSIPAFGSFMNGLSYTANRWCFVCSLLVAVTFSFTYDKIFNLNAPEKVILLTELLVIGIITFFFSSNPIVKVMFFIISAIIIILLLLQNSWFQRNQVIANLFVFVLVLFSLIFNGYGLYSRNLSNYSNQFLNKREVAEITGKGPLSMIKEIQDPSFYRIETYGDMNLNEALTLGYHDVSGYFSLMDKDITSYLKDLEILNQRMAYSFLNLDTRATIDSLASVKYFVATNKAAAPTGYELQKQSNIYSNQYYLFKNLYALPLGYTYENYILREDYDKLSALEKQNIMLSAVVLDQNTDYADKEGAVISSNIKKLDVKVIPDENVSIDNHRIDVKKRGATVTLEFNSPPDSETYIRLNQLVLHKKNGSMVNFDVTGETSVIKNVDVRSPYNNSYFGKENYLIHIGYSADGQNKAVLSFPDRMNFQMNQIEAYSVDMSDYTEKLQALCNSQLTNIVQKGNRIKGDITLKQKGIMALSIPYSKGWRVYVDGERRDLLKANVMYMALPLEAGSHNIILKYRTPYLSLGFCLSLCAVLILIGLIIYYHKLPKQGNFKANKKE